MSRAVSFTLSMVLVALFLVTFIFSIIGTGSSQEKKNGATWLYAFLSNGGLFNSLVLLGGAVVCLGIILALPLPKREAVREGRED
ncbi:MAG: hypothetical protein EZS28_026234 [Streblomastix strix]|uniref:Uncharacterized protein n=1 Tax=Streblomastix strix TaxID=222440 RepID=A0A5J4V7B1_9EUKA|nr:MAG: hypothetical protein EZS28_026234 [Streblomastix strix]